MKDKFLDYLQNIKKYSDNTIINYEIDIDRYEKFLNQKVLYREVNKESGMKR